MNLARRYLVESFDVTAADAAAIERGQVMDRLMAAADVDAWGARDLLWSEYSPSGMWLWFTLIGLGSMVLLVGYDRLIRRAEREPAFSFNTRGRAWVQAVVVPAAALVAACAVYQAWGLAAAGETVGQVILGSLGLGANAILLALLAVASFVMQDEPRGDEPGKPTEF